MSLKGYKLTSSIYGLKQGPKKWNQIFDEVVLSSSFKLKQTDMYL